MQTELHARDLMQTGVISLPADATLENAVRTFEEYRISGCPIVDRTGKVIGVLSASDITNSSRVEGGHLQGRPSTYYLADLLGEGEDPEEFLMEGYNADAEEGVRVSELMTARVVSIDPDAPVERVCQVMVEERVHRVLVTEEDALVGIVSSFDIVRAVAGLKRES